MVAIIQSYLDKIMKAIYGKEVRSSIHDAIKAIDEEVEETTSKVASWEQNEIQRQSAENERQTKEQGRNVAENIRNTNENTRICQESSRAGTEDARVSAENARIASEADRAESESHRASMETGDRLGSLEHRVFDVKTHHMIEFEDMAEVQFELGVPFEAPGSGFFVLSFLYLGPEPTKPVQLVFSKIKPTPETTAISEDGSGPPPDESFDLPLGAASITLSFQLGAINTSAIIFFYLSNEGVLLLENAAHLGLPIPEKLKSVLMQLHDRDEKEEINHE